MIRTTDTIPKIYSSSCDMLIFMALLDALAASNEIDIARIRGAHSYANCFEEDLKHLSSFINLDTTDRDLISQYNLLSKHKGTKKAVEAALSYSGLKDIVMGEEKGDYLTTVKVTADLSGFIDYILLDTLLRRWLPINVRISITPS